MLWCCLWATSIPPVEEVADVADVADAGVDQLFGQWQAALCVCKLWCTYCSPSLVVPGRVSIFLNWIASGLSFSSFDTYCSRFPNKALIVLSCIRKTYRATDSCVKILIDASISVSWKDQVIIMYTSVCVVCRCFFLAVNIHEALLWISVIIFFIFSMVPESIHSEFFKSSQFCCTTCTDSLRANFLAH